MSFTILSHFTQGIDNFFAEFCTFHNRLNLNENVKEADGRIDYLSGLASDQQADIVNQHFSQLLWKYISKFLKKNDKSSLTCKYSFFMKRKYLRNKLVKWL